MSTLQRRLKILMLNQAYLVEPLRALGHSVLSIGCTEGLLSDPFDLQISDPPLLTLQQVYSYLPNGFQPDVLVFNDSSEFPRFLGLERASVPTLFFSVDAHIHSSWHKFFGGAFDKVLLAQPDYLNEYCTVNPDTTWFPLWAKEFIEPSTERPIDVSFRGSFSPTTQPSRIHFFDQLSKYLKVDFGSGPYPEIYGSSKIVVNHVLKDDLNFRVFEGMGCGALMVTPSIKNGMGELFKDGEDLISFRNEEPADAAEKIRSLLADESTRSRIALNGYNKVKTFHSAAVRAHTLSEILVELTSRKDLSKHLFAVTSYLHNVRALQQSGSEIRLILLSAGVQTLVNYLQAGGERNEMFQALVSALAQGLLQEQQDELAKSFLNLVSQFNLQKSGEG